MAQVTIDKDFNRNVILTQKESVKLELCLIMTEKWRKENIAAWQDLANEKDENGNPRFARAASNAEWLKQLDVFINDIVNGLRGY